MNKILRQVLWIIVPLFIFGFIYAYIKINTADTIEILGIPWSLTYFLIALSSIVFWAIITKIMEESD